MYNCNICNVKKMSLKGYFIHQRLHSTCASFQCTIENCARKFNNYYTFKSHMRRDHMMKHNRKYFHSEFGEIGQIVACSLKLCQEKFTDKRLYFQHLRSHFQEGYTVECPIKNCTSKFKTKQSFDTHISRYHRKHSFEDLIGNCKKSNIQIEDKSLAASRNIDVDIELNEPFSMDCDENLFLRNMACFYLKLEAKLLVPASTIKFIVNELNNINHIGTDYLEMKVKAKLSEKGLEQTIINSICNEIQESNLIQITQGTGPLRTCHRRKQYYKENLNYVKPEHIQLGQDNSNKNCSYYYVPIIETISGMLKDNSVKELFQISQATEQGIFKDFTDGFAYKENIFFQTNNSIKLILYQDAFELVNPLGSAKKVYKILAVYLVLGNMPSYCRFKPDSMQLVLLCFEKDFVHFGKDRLLARLMYDLQKLEDGIPFHGQVMKGSLLFMLGDNLGSHGIGGYLESFAGVKYFCRYCVCTRRDWIKKKYKVSEFPIRTVVSYKKDVAYLERHPEDRDRHGIKSDSPLNKLQYFHVSTPGLPPCLAHDIFEGVVQYDVPLILTYLTKVKKWFTLDNLNKRIMSFPYTDEDVTNKPATLPLKCKKLIGHAVQNWSLLRFLPLIIADKIQNDAVWSLFLLLQEIVELVCSPKIMGRQIEYLEDLIDDYLKARKRLFPDMQERPKHHYLCHYPWLIQQCGPLIHLWTLRGESKHSYFRRCIRSSQNFINPLYSLSERHQLLQSYLSTGELYSSGVKNENAEPFDCKLYKHSISSAVANCPELHSHLNDLCVCFKVELKGTLYKKNSVVVIGIGDHVMELIFGQILFALISKSQAVYLIVQLCSSSFNPLLRAYELHDSGNVKCCNIESLLDYFPMSVYNISGAKYIKLKHSIAIPMP